MDKKKQGPSLMKMYKPDTLEKSKVDIRSFLSQIEDVQEELDKIIDKENDDIISVAEKYKELKLHYYRKRDEIAENIPDYWFNILTSHPDVCKILTEEDEDCLLFLNKLEVTIPSLNKNGYSIKLHFSENPFFRNSLLVKEALFENDKLVFKNTKIEWKTNELPILPKTNSSKSKLKTSAALMATTCSMAAAALTAPTTSTASASSTVSSPRKRKRKFTSFFNWFSNTEDAADDNISEIFKDDIYPNAIQYYLIADPDLDDENTSESSDDEGRLVVCEDENVFVSCDSEEDLAEIRPFQE